jgi:hypothetical protein
MPLIEPLIIAPTSFVLSSIFSIIEAGISKKGELDGVNCGGGPEAGDAGLSALSNTSNNKIN